MLRHTVNLIIDVVSLLAGLGLLATGLLIYFIPPAGSGGGWRGGRGEAPTQIEPAPTAAQRAVID